MIVVAHREYGSIYGRERRWLATIRCFPWLVEKYYTNPSNFDSLQQLGDSLWLKRLVSEQARLEPVGRLSPVF